MNEWMDNTQAIQSLQKVTSSKASASDNQESKKKKKEAVKTEASREVFFMWSVLDTCVMFVLHCGCISISKHKHKHTVWRPAAVWYSITSTLDSVLWYSWTPGLLLSLSVWSSMNGWSRRATLFWPSERRAGNPSPFSCLMDRRFRPQRGWAARISWPVTSGEELLSRGHSKTSNVKNS